MQARLHHPSPHPPNPLPSHITNVAKLLSSFPAFICPFKHTCYGLNGKSLPLLTWMLGIELGLLEEEPVLLTMSHFSRPSGTHFTTSTQAYWKAMSFVSIEYFITPWGWLGQGSLHNSVWPWSSGWPWSPDSLLQPLLPAYYWDYRHGSTSLLI